MTDNQTDKARELVQVLATSILDDDLKSVCDIWRVPPVYMVLPVSGRGLRVLDARATIQTLAQHALEMEDE